MSMRFPSQFKNNVWEPKLLTILQVKRKLQVSHSTVEIMKCMQMKQYFT